MTVALTALAPGQAAVICGFAESEEHVHRLMEMGLVEGTEITLVRYAPAGDPLEIQVMGYALSLRKSEAAGILVRDVRDV